MRNCAWGIDKWFITEKIRLSLLENGDNEEKAGDPQAPIRLQEVLELEEKLRSNSDPGGAMKKSFCCQSYSDFLYSLQVQVVSGARFAYQVRQSRAEDLHEL